MKDGGSAFPNCEAIRDKDTGALISIGMKGGMTLRDWFAGQALAGYCGCDGEINSFYAAKFAYEVADAMFARREV